MGCDPHPNLPLVILTLTLILNRFHPKPDLNPTTTKPKPNPHPSILSAENLRPHRLEFPTHSRQAEHQEEQGARAELPHKRV